jgi:S1-C subfamily serine protease
MPFPGLSELSREISGVIAEAAPALAAVDASRHSSSSAIHWSDGLFVAANEAVEADEGIEITLSSGDRVPAELKGRDPTTGLALLQSEAVGGVRPETAVPVAAGHLAIVVGHGETSPVAAFGLVSEAGPAWRSMRGGLIDRRIRLSAQVDSRAEGGAALDAEGRLIGLVLFDPYRRPLVIPAETLERVVPALAEQGHVPRGYLGAGLHPIRHRDMRGAMVMSLEEGGPAQKAGIMIGDIITSWNGEQVQGMRDLMRRLGPDAVGRVTSLGILRGGEARSLDVTIGARPRR